LLMIAKVLSLVNMKKRLGSWLLWLPTRREIKTSMAVRRFKSKVKKIS
jgi:hypothetical protein